MSQQKLHFVKTLGKLHKFQRKFQKKQNQAKNHQETFEIAQSLDNISPNKQPFLAVSSPDAIPDSHPDANVFNQQKFSHDMTKVIKFIQDNRISNQADKKAAKPPMSRSLTSSSKQFGKNGEFSAYQDELQKVAQQASESQT